MSACVFCGAPGNWQETADRQPWERDATASGWQREQWTRFDAGAVNTAVLAGATYERRKPVRRARVDSDVLVPLYQSLVSAAVGGVIIGSGAALFGVGWSALLYGAVGGAGLLGLSWRVLLSEHRAALWETERIIGQDLDGDGVVGEPVAVLEPVRVEVSETDQDGRLKRMVFASLPCSDVQLLALARGLLNGKTFSLTSWTGRGKPFSRREYDAVRDELLQRGLARWVNPNAHAQGCKLSAAGRGVMRRVVELADGTHARTRTHATSERVSGDLASVGGYVQ